MTVAGATLVKPITLSATATPKPTAADDPPDMAAVAASALIVANICAILRALTTTSPVTVAAVPLIRALTAPFTRFTAMAPPPVTAGVEPEPKLAEIATDDDRPEAVIVEVRCPRTERFPRAVKVGTSTICAVTFDWISLRAKVTATPTALDLVLAVIAVEVDFTSAVIRDLSCASIRMSRPA